MCRTFGAIRYSSANGAVSRRVVRELPIYYKRYQPSIIHAKILSHPRPLCLGIFALPIKPPHLVAAERPRCDECNAVGVDIVGRIDRIIGVMTFCAGDVLTERVADIKAQAKMVVEGGVSKLGVKQGQTFLLGVHIDIRKIMGVIDA